MNVFELEIVCERDQRCVRRVEFLASHALWDVHRCIQREFNLDNDHVWSFYLSGEYHDPDTEFGGTPLDGARRQRRASANWTSKRACPSRTSSTSATSCGTRCAWPGSPSGNLEWSPPA